MLELAALTLSSCSQQRYMPHEHCCKIPCSVKQTGLMSNEFSFNSDLQIDTVSKQLSEKASSKQYHSSLCLGCPGGCFRSTLGAGCCVLCLCLCASLSSDCSVSLREEFSLTQVFLQAGLEGGKQNPYISSCKFNRNVGVTALQK